MKDLEREFRRTLKRTDPPEGFAERVLARIGRDTPKKQKTLWMAVAAALVIALAGIGAYNHHRHEEALKAKTDLLRAFEITSDTLQQTRVKLLKRRTRGDI